MRRGIPDWYGIVPTTFSVASSMIQYCFGYDPMINVPLPALIRGFSAVKTVRTGSDIASVSAAARGSVFMMVTGK